MRCEPEPDTTAGIPTNAVALATVTDRRGDPSPSAFRVTHDITAPAVNAAAEVQNDDIIVNGSTTDPASGLDACALEVRKGEGTWQ